MQQESPSPERDPAGRPVVKMTEHRRFPSPPPPECAWVMKSEAEKMSNYPSLKGREAQAKGGQCSSSAWEKAAK